jgi:type III secretion protein Q
VTPPAEARSLLALAAVFAPARASRLCARWGGDESASVAEEAARAASAPRVQRLAVLAAAIEDARRRDGGDAPRLPRERSRASGVLRRLRLAPDPDREADLGPGGEPCPRSIPASTATDALARCVNLAPRVALPFDMPAFSRGFAHLTARARELGERAAGEAGRALGALTGGEVAITGRALPGVPAPCAGWTRLRVELTALPGTAALEVEAPVAIAFLDRLGGGPGTGEPAIDVTRLERAALELAVLAAIDGVASLPEVEGALAPRLARSSCEPAQGLAIDLAISVGAHRGRGRLILPHAAVAALGGEDEGWAAAGLSFDLSLRGASAPLSPEELTALQAGDVLLLDPPPPGRLTAVVPGGLRIAGAAKDDGLVVEEILMPGSSSEWPITLEVELARVPMTVGELARLQPGVILPLPVDRRGMVSLKLGDRSIGRGQLVDVEGAVGIRIDSLVGEGQ